MNGEASGLSRVDTRKGRRGWLEPDTTSRETCLGSQSCLTKRMLQAILSAVFAAVMWVQVPQWQPDWSQCSVDTPDVDCHWYVVAPDNTFGEGFSWENAPWFSVEGLQDVAQLSSTMNRIHEQASADA